MKITAPAGSPESFQAAIQAGADEVYMGLDGFGARRFAVNFSVEEYCRAIDQAHRNDVRVLLTLNTIMSDDELTQIEPLLYELWATGLDAAIVQDFGLVRRLKRNFPDLPLHASTQISPANVRDLQWLEKQEFKRAVLARELSLSEIAEIRRQTSIELEVFASGALCLCCSGKCYLSSFIGGRSGNRGMCAQPCRRLYSICRDDDRSNDPLNSTKKPDSYSSSNESEIGVTNRRSDNNDDSSIGYFLSTKDQWQEEAEIRRLVELGVESIKIEGRMKSPVYVFEAVRYYRRLLDKIAGISPEESRKRLSIKSDSPRDGANASQCSILSERSQNERINSTKLERPNNQPSFSNSQKSNRSRNNDLSTDSNEPEIKREIERIFNRGYAKGYFYEHDPAFVNSNYSADAGVRIGTIKNGVILLSDSIRNGDGIVYLDLFGRKISGHNVGEILLISNVDQNVQQKNPLKNGNENSRDVNRNKKFIDRRKSDSFFSPKTTSIKVDAAFSGQTILLESRPPQDARFLNKTFDISVDRRITNAVRQTNRRTPIDVELRAQVGFPIELRLTHSRGEIFVSSENKLEVSRKSTVSEETLKNDLDRFGASPFYMKRFRIVFDPDVFVPKSLLNQLRQDATLQLERRILESFRRSTENRTPEESPVSTVALDLSDRNFATNSNIPSDRSNSSFDVSTFPLRETNSENRSSVRSNLKELVFSASVRTQEQFEACLQAGFRRVYYSARPVVFQDDLSARQNLLVRRFSESNDRLLTESSSGFKPERLAGSLLDAIHFNERQERFAADWTFNLGNLEAILFYLERFPYLETVFLSPELSERTCGDLLKKIDEKFSSRPVRFGLCVYGNLAAMTTRKTLFNQKIVRLVDQDDREIVVAKNVDWFDDATSGTTGSSVYYEKPLDIIDAIPWLRQTGFDELRFDFVAETPREIRSLLKRATQTTAGNSYSIFSYGFGKGIF